MITVSLSLISGHILQIVVPGIVLTGFQGILGIVFLVAGGVKVAGVEPTVEHFEHYHYPQWFRFGTGMIEVFGGLGMVISLFVVPWLTVFAGGVIVATMVGAVFTHLRVNDPVGKMIPPTVLLVIALTVILLRWGS